MQLYNQQKSSFGGSLISFQSQWQDCSVQGEGEEGGWDGGLAAFSLPGQEEVIRTPKEGAKSTFPADSLERKVIILISSLKFLVY